MSTNGMTDWAVDLNNIGAIYPFQGTEGIMVVLGFVFWIGWHIWQIRQENAELEDEKNRGTGQRAKDAIERY